MKLTGTVLLFVALTFSPVSKSQTDINTITMTNTGDTLSQQEKLQIRLEEEYRKEVRDSITASKQIDWVERVTRVAQGLAVIIGIIVALYQLTKQVEDRRQLETLRLEQTAREYRKYFYEKQFEYYAEAVDAAATIATEEKNSAAYLQARSKFFRMFWGKLSMVEERSVEASMIRFKDLLLAYETPNSAVSRKQIEQASLCLAHEASWYTINIWVDKGEINNYSDRRCIKR